MSEPKITVDLAALCADCRKALGFTPATNTACVRCGDDVNVDDDDSVARYDTNQVFEDDILGDPPEFNIEEPDNDELDRV